MAVPSTSSSSQKDTYLVIGGSGFVGRHIVQKLLKRGDNVSVFDIVQRYHDTPFYSGDIAEEGSISSALQKVCFYTSMHVGNAWCSYNPV
jgi:sterol-4alpha-carboxylate 3-dehydrogenase (decarboxylating)